MTAFTINNFDRLSASVNTSVNNIFGYTDTSNTLATMEASGFFNAVNISSTVNPIVNINDGIRIVGSDGVDMAYVTAISPNITLSVQVDIPAGAITNAMVSATAAIAFSKLAPLTSAHILVGNGSNVATDVAVTGDVTISNAGVTAIGPNKVTLSALASGVTPGYVLKNAISGTYGGGGTSTTLSNGIILSGDLVVIWLTGSTNLAAISKTVVTTGQAVISFTTDPGAATTYTALVFRAAS